jgi:hypothetical protein
MVDLKMSVMMGEVDGYDNSFKEEYGITSHTIVPTDNGHGEMTVSFSDISNMEKFKWDFDIE